MWISYKLLVILLRSQSALEINIDPKASEMPHYQVSELVRADAHNSPFSPPYCTSDMVGFF